MKVGDLVRLAPDSVRASYLPKLTKYVGIIKEKHRTEAVVVVFWTRTWTTGEWEEDLEVIHESR